MHQNLEFLVARLAEVDAIFASMTAEEIKQRGESAEAEIDEIDAILQTDLSPEDFQDLMEQRNRLLEEIPGHGPEMLANEIDEIQLREENRHPL